jgi:hypothetical protein
MACLADAGASERLTKQVKGLLNRLAEANLQSTVEQSSELLQAESRRAVIQGLTDELLQVNHYCKLLPNHNFLDSIHATRAVIPKDAESHVLAAAVS